VVSRPVPATPAAGRSADFENVTSGLTIVESYFRD
jgi:hypothetical protein